MRAFAGGTNFLSFKQLLDPIHAPKGGQAAWILTQEIRDQQFPLNSGDGLKASRNFAPWSDFRTFSDEVFAAAQKRCGVYCNSHCIKSSHPCNA